MSIYYTSPATVRDGDVAYAKDVNSINTETDTGFSLVETDITAMEATVSAWSNLARKWAENPEDTEVALDSYSAMHWALKSESFVSSAQNYSLESQGYSVDSSNAATLSATYASNSSDSANDSAASASLSLSCSIDATNSATEASGYSNKAQKWAEEAEDVGVETGKYSAYHWSQKAYESYQLATDALTDVEDELAGKADITYVDAELADSPNATTAGPDKIPVTNPSGDGWDYIAAIVDPERPVRLGDTSLRENLKVTVGDGGDFPTINEAVLYLSRFTPDLGVTAEVELMSGFVMEEQLFVEGLDLGWITITGVDAETVIDEPSLTRTLGDTGYKPAFGVINGTLPTIGQLFIFSSKGNREDGRSGVVAYSVGRATILAGCGVKNAGVQCIAATYSSTINAFDAIASGSGVNGIDANRGSTINASGADASGAGINGITATYSSTINANDADASGAGDRGIYAQNGSTINANGANASGAGGSGIFSASNSTINANGADASGAGQYGIIVNNGSTINARDSTGTLNQAKNTIHNHGIIFQP